MKRLLPLSLLPLSAAKNHSFKLTLPTTTPIDYTRYKPPGVKRYNPSSPNDACYLPLYYADADGDGAVNHEEYVNFISGMESRLDYESFRELSFVLKVNFVYLSCLCQDGGNNCCNVGGDGSISISGTSPNDTPTEDQLRYLDTVCSTTQASIDYALEELPPSPQPTLLPSSLPTSSPSLVTERPTYIETTEWPVWNEPYEGSPSGSPTGVPTVTITEGSEAPVDSTSDAPVASSTDAPISSATNAPIIGTPTPINTSPAPSSSAIITPPTSSGVTTTLPSLTTTPTIPKTALGSEEEKTTIDSGEEKTTTLSTGSIAGIVLASVLVVTCTLLLTRKRTRQEDEVEFPKDAKHDLEAQDLDIGPPSPTNADADISSYGMPEVIPTSPESRTSRSSRSISRSPHSSRSPPHSSPTSHLSPYSDKLNLQRMPSEDSSSSSAGQSGWSSSQGLSSLNTASFDCEDGSGVGGGSRGGSYGSGSHGGSYGSGGRGAQTPYGTALAAMGVASAVTYRTVGNYGVNQGYNSQSNRVEDEGSLSSEEEAVSRKDLDAAIEAGDWAAVGATAALLANTNEKRASEEDQRNQRTLRVSDELVDNSRTNELDKLVEAGDWEGVVLAAAQFEGGPSDMASNDGTHEVLDDASVPSLLARGRKEKNVDAIRAEVELLVRRIVPDELDNIDDMMIQFQGRENDLIDTLKTMQRRSEAQRARAAVQQSAKIEARARGHVSGAGSITSSSESRSHSVTEEGVEVGDWQAVGQSAAMMGTSVIEDDTVDHSHSSSLSSSLSSSRSRTASRDSFLSRDKSERIQHLDNLIAKGDWAGIVAVASQYQAMDEEIGQSPPIDAQATEEERDALAQAEMWRAIAHQSKQDISSPSQGAKEAADWAISRSLMKHSAPTSSSTDQPASKVAKIESYEDDLSV